MARPEGSMPSLGDKGFFRAEGGGRGLAVFFGTGGVGAVCVWFGGGLAARG